MKKIFISICIFFFLSIGNLTPVQAEEDINQQVIDDQQSKIQIKIMEAKTELDQVKNELDKLNEQIVRVEQAINDNNRMIAQTEENINNLQIRIKNLEQEVQSLNEKVIKRNEILKKRALTFQETGGKVSYLDVLLGSTSFKDFVDRIGAVASLVEADQNLVKQHQTDKQSVEKKQSLVKSKLSELQMMKTELEGMRSQILEQQELNNSLKEELKKKQQEKTAEQANLQLQDQNLNSISGSNATDSNEILKKALLDSDETIQNILIAGFRYIGNSVYVFGGGRNEYDIENGRFDCSGFVSWAFTQGGISIGSSTEVLKNTGEPVNIKEILPGDLVFFDTYKKDGHVGIYLGDGKFIGSQSSTGVAIADMTDGYWLEKFNGRVNRINTK